MKPTIAEPRYPQVTIDVAADLADEAAGLLFELGAEGIEERDDTTLASGPGQNCLTIVATFADAALAEEAARALDPAWSPRTGELVGDAWRDEWKKHFVPFRLTPRIVVRPPWEAYAAKEPHEIVLDLEPGRAFGTGLHATTSLVARALEARASELRGIDVLDVGTGSGILALVALALGARQVRAIDIDPDAAEVTKENAARNGMGERIEVDTAPLASIAATYPIVTANIEARVLIPMFADLAARVSSRGLLVLSGILREQEGDIRRTFEGAFSIDEVVSQDDWIAVVLRALG